MDKIFGRPNIISFTIFIKKKCFDFTKTIKRTLNGVLSIYKYITANLFNKIYSSRNIKRTTVNGKKVSIPVQHHRK